jgi:hypothetical protein
MMVLVALAAVLLSACGSDDDSAEAGSIGEMDFDAAEESDFATDGAEAEPSVETEAGEAMEEAMEDDAMEESTSDAAPASADGQLVPAEPDAVDGDADPLGAGGTQVTPTAADLGRKLIFTAFVEVEVDDVAAASAEATSIVQGLGGFLFGQNTTGGAQPSSQLIFKVLPDDFNRVLEQLGTVGELRNQSVSTDDVTERIVDLESRIEVADLGVARLRAALEGAATLEDYAEIERLLLSRESELEVMRGQLRTLQDRVDLATITLTLSQDRVENAMNVEISLYDGFDGGQSCPGQQLGSAEAGSEVTICFEVFNLGDQTLTDIVLTDSVLEIDDDSPLIEVFGSLSELAPGQSALVAYEIQPERTVRLRTRAVAIPTDGISSEPSGPSVSTQAEYELRTFEPDTDPGFGDGFGVAVTILKGLWIALLWLLGFIVPLLILVPFIWLAWRGLKMLNARRPKKPMVIYSAGPGGGTPPPPPPPGNNDPQGPVGGGSSGEPVGSDAGPLG